MIKKFFETFNNEISLINDIDTTQMFRKNLTIEILNSHHRGLLKTTEWLTDILNSKSLDMCNDAICNFSTSFAPHTLKYITGKAFYDQNEFLRCSHHLKDSLNKHPILDFLYFYSRFKAGLKRLNESEMLLMKNESQRCYNDLISLNEEISEFINDNPNHDSYILCLRGIILKKLNLFDEAKSVLIEALKKNEYCWCAWYELSDITDSDDIDFPRNWMTKFFEVKYLKITNDKEQCDKKINMLIKNGFENVQDLKIDLAIVNETTIKSLHSVEIYNKIYENDPYRMDYFCAYSNLLFVQEDHRRLAELTDNCLKIDRYRFETCCVVGNFYSLRGKHEKALIYFERALKLNPTDSNTWILIGHEYLEMDNFQTADKCYSKAISNNPRSYRAYYSLGQLYEMMNVPEYALFFYRKAFELMPNDSRVLIGLGTVYEDLGRIDDAKLCYSRAHDVGDVEVVAFIKLGKLYEKINDRQKAAVAFELYLIEVKEIGFIDIQNLSHAYLFLANFHWNFTGNLEKARYYAENCCKIPDTKAAAQDMIKSIDLARDGVLAQRKLQESLSRIESTISSDKNLSENTTYLSTDEDTVEINNQEFE